MSRPAEQTPVPAIMRLLEKSAERDAPLDHPPAAHPRNASASGQERHHRDVLLLARELAVADSVTQLQDSLDRYLRDRIGARRVRIAAAGDADMRIGRIAALAERQLKVARVARVRDDDGHWFALPLEYRGIRQGILLVGMAADAAPDDAATALEVAELAAFIAAGEMARLLDYRRVEEHLSDLNVIRALDREISQARDMRTMADIVHSQIGSVVACTLCALLMVDDEGTHLEVVALRNEAHVQKLGFKVPLDGSRAGGVYRSGQPVVVGNILDDEGAYSRDTANWRSLMIAPLTSGGRRLGVLMIGHPEANRYGERDLRVTELVASQVANAIYRFLEEEREQDQHLAAIEALSAAVDARDPMTHTHSRRVADLAYMVAREMGLSEHEARQVELAGLLHDIGKIGIPDRILTKPGGLDTEERLIMMSHADMGARIVERSSALAHLTPIVRHHHEWYDGRGYPDGLRGDEIPLSAAILGVADALETMTSNRVYRRALPLEQARLEIERGRGSQFHPRAADVVLRLMDTNPVVMELLESAQSAHSGSANLAPIRSSDVVALRVLNRIAEEIGALTELDLFLDHVHGILREELDIADVIIWLQDEENKAYMLAAGTAGLPSPTNLEPLRQRDATPASFASEISTMLRRSDELGPNSVICPMFVEDSLVGMIELVLHSADVVDDRDIDLLQAIAAPVASTIRVAQLHDHAKRAARTDGLTGVLNHRTFYQELDRRMSSISGDDEVHLLIIDVIGLKATNDNYGHVAGDRALRTIAQELVKRVRAEDIVSRYGGDEFAIILQGPLDTPVESIIERIEQPVMCELDSGPILSIRLRCGHAVSNAREGRATELVARADALLYARVRPTERGAA